MLTFVTRRLLLAVPVLLGVVFVVMLTIDLLPGDAVTLMLGEHATRDAVANLRAHLGLDKPFLVRYLDYVGQLLRGDLGRSFQQNRPVAAELSDAWPATLELTIAALLIAAVVGIVAGIASAVWPNSLFDGVARLFAVRALDADLLDGPRLHRDLLAVAPLAAGRRHGITHSPDPARRHAGAAVGGDDRAHDTLGRARRPPRGLRAHGAGQGRRRGVGARPARAAQRLHPDPHAARAAVGPAHGRRRPDRDGLRVAGARPSHGEGDLRPRLRPAPGRGARLRAGL